ncbi:hypothetical protein, partial [Salimicrobium album]|uniref:hypothetical protein n=1 Tax=Salimicrobium album TaxID=50717 RepID=UPI0015A41BCB
ADGQSKSALSFLPGRTAWVPSFWSVELDKAKSGTNREKREHKQNHPGSAVFPKRERLLMDEASGWCNWIS